MPKPQRVIDGNRITLPKDFVEKNGIKEGGFVMVEETKDGNLLIKPAKVVTA